ncbi:MAG: DUF4177 domain-containing protein [Maritimibacter sp.]|nr:DUF4177 domain-containing protein [Maritimibacter sp.]MCB2111612.1 DUF4177 domain-containing protein [Paracoccaceae bacterium]
MTFEYKVVPAPTRGRKAKGVKTPADRFAHALEEVINELAAEGWEYIRTDTLPAQERTGLTGRTTVYQNMLVFRRAATPAVKAEPEAARSVKAPAPAVATTQATKPVAPAAPKPEPQAVRPQPQAARQEPLALRPAPQPAPAAAPTVTPAPAAAPAKGDLSSMIANEIAAAKAPKLPSAGAAQSMPAARAPFPGAGIAKRDVAAE